MSLDFSKILQSVEAVGAATPAFKMLFDQIVNVLQPHEQAELQRVYDLAMADSDNAHMELQALTKKKKT